MIKSEGLIRQRVENSLDKDLLGGVVINKNDREYVIFSFHLDYVTIVT